MDLNKLNTENPALTQWHDNHPFCSLKEFAEIHDLVESEAFRTWQKSHPYGTVDQYLNMSQINSSPNFSSYDEEIEELDFEIAQLKESNQKLQTEIDYYKWKTNNLQESCNILKTTSISFAIIIIILVFLLWRKWH